MSLNGKTKIISSIFSLILAIAICAPAAAFELPDGVVTCSEMNVRRDATPASEVFWKLRKGEHVRIKAINGEFYKVKLSESKDGYAHNSCLDVSVFAHVINTGAWIQKSPGAAADVVGDLRGLSWVRIINKWQNWYEVVLNDRVTSGWVEQSSLQAPAEFFAAWLTFKHDSPLVADTRGQASSAYRSRYMNETQNTRPNLSLYSGGNENLDPNSTRYSIISFAKGFLGTPYVYGGNSPSEGFDCSGFVEYVFKNHGIKLDRPSTTMALEGMNVSPSELLPGDLVFFSNKASREINHVGIYVGGGNFIHASSSGKSGSYVRISPLFEGHYRDNFVTARRVLPN